MKILKQQQYLLDVAAREEAAADVNAMFQDVGFVQDLLGGLPGRTDGSKILKFHHFPLIFDEN